MAAQTKSKADSQLRDTLSALAIHTGLTSLDVERQRRVERPGQHVLDRASDLDLENLDPQRQILERQPEHLGQRVVLHLRLVPELGKQVERHTLLHSTRSSPSLGSVRLGDPRLDQLRDLSLLVEPGRRKRQSVRGSKQSDEDITED